MWPCTIPMVKLLKRFMVKIITVTVPLLFSCFFSALWPRGLQHTRLPCPSPFPSVYANSHPLSWWCHPDISSSVIRFSSSFNISQHQGLFRWVGSLHPVAKYWSYSISPSNEYLGLISFRIDWLDRLAVQGTLKNLLQHHNSKASGFWCSAFFMVQLSHPYMTAGKIICVIMQTFVSKVMSLLFNTLSTFVTAFLPRNKRLNFMAAVTVHSDFGAQENKSLSLFPLFPSLFAVKWCDWMPWS